MCFFVRGVVSASACVRASVSALVFACPGCWKDAFLCTFASVFICCLIVLAYNYVLAIMSAFHLCISACVFVHVCVYVRTRVRSWLYEGVCACMRFNTHACVLTRAWLRPRGCVYVLGQSLRVNARCVIVMHDAPS